MFTDAFQHEGRTLAASAASAAPAACAAPAATFAASAVSAAPAANPADLAASAAKEVPWIYMATFECKEFGHVRRRRRAKNVFHFIFILAHGLILSNSSSEYDQLCGNMPVSSKDRL